MQVLVADSDKFAYPIAEPWAKLVHMIQQREKYSHIISASGSFGKNVLPRAAALLDVSPITDVIEISGFSQFVRCALLSLFCFVAMTTPSVQDVICFVSYYFFDGARGLLKFIRPFKSIINHI